jgi:Skp family chaperone for outer membrane proteins
VQRYLPGFIEESFRDFLEQEGQSLGKALEGLAEHIIAVTNENLREAAEALNDELGLDPKSIDVTVDSTAYDFSVFALGAFGVSVLVFINALVGGLIALATPVVAYVLKGRLDAQVKSKAGKAGDDAIRTVAAKAEGELVAMIEDFGERLRQFVDDAGDRLYRQIEEALQAVLAERDATGGNAALLDEKAAETESSVAREISELSEERQKLWASALH